MIRISFVAVSFSRLFLVLLVVSSLAGVMSPSSYAAVEQGLTSRTVVPPKEAVHDLFIFVKALLNFVDESDKEKEGSIGEDRFWADFEPILDKRSSIMTRFRDFSLDDYLGKRPDLKKKFDILSEKYTRYEARKNESRDFYSQNPGTTELYFFRPWYISYFNKKVLSPYEEEYQLQERLFRCCDRIDVVAQGEAIEITNPCLKVKNAKDEEETQYILPSSNLNDVAKLYGFPIILGWEFADQGKHFKAAVTYGRSKGAEYPPSSGYLRKPEGLKPETLVLKARGTYLHKLTLKVANINEINEFLKRRAEGSKRLELKK